LAKWEGGEAKRAYTSFIDEDKDFFNSLGKKTRDRYLTENFQLHREKAGSLGRLTKKKKGWLLFESQEGLAPGGEEGN